MWSLFEKHLLSFPHEVTLRLLIALPIDSVFTLAKVSRCTRSVCNAYLSELWSFDYFFRQWFSDTAKFRRLLRRCNAVVSGSQALQFLDCCYFDGSDLDIFLRPAGFDRLSSWLANIGYQPYKIAVPEYNALSEGNLTMKCVIAQASAAPTTILGVYSYAKYVRLGSRLDLKIVQLIVTQLDPIEHIISAFHSTAVMNWITADEAISVFPRLTFTLRQSYILLPYEGNLEPKWVLKYKARGFHLVHKTSTESACNVPNRRTTNDSSCLRVSLGDSERHIAPEKTYYGKITPVRFDIVQDKDDSNPQPSMSTILPRIRFHVL